MPPRKMSSSLGKRTLSVPRIDGEIARQLIHS